jgi:hypothetical protein
MIFSVMLLIIGAILFIFLFWKKLREDYPANYIFTTAIYSLLGLFLFDLVFSRYLHSWWFYGTILGSVLGLLIGVLRYKLRFYETYEAFVVGILPLSSFVMLSDAVSVRSLASFIYFVFIVILMGLFYTFDKHYKKFSWYKSGRIGFSGLTISGIFFLVRAIVASFFPYVLSFTGKLESIISGIVAFTFFLLVFSLSRQKI